MGKPEPPRMKHLARYLRPLPLSTVDCRLSTPINPLPQHGMSRRREMQADLVGAPGLELDRDERRAPEFLFRPVPRDGPFPPLSAARDAAPDRPRCRHEIGREGP